MQLEKAAEKAKVINDNIEPPYPKQLIIDMPIRWSSTYLMLNRADQLWDVCSFISAAMDGCLTFV